MKPISIEKLFESNNLNIIDYLYIDCEGEDFNIINSVDFEKFNIKKITFEHAHIPNRDENYPFILNKLKNYGYEIDSIILGNITLIKNVNYINKITKIYKMKYSVLKHNKNGNYQDCYDGYLNAHWFSVLANMMEFTHNHEEADFTILPIVWEPNYEYDESINSINFKNLIILDFMEVGCGTWPDKRYQQNFYSFFGLKHEPYDGFFERDKQFLRLHENLNVVLKDKIRIYFKRELSNLLDLSNLGVKVLPADFINTYKEYTPCTEDEFWKRGLDILYIWGRSSQDRVKLYGMLFAQMDRFGHNMYSSEKQYDEELIKNKRDYV